MQRAWVAPLVIMGALSVGGAVGAQTTPEGPSVAARAEARTHFQAGVAAYTRGQWAAALGEFQSAYRLAPHPSVRVNIANCFDHLDQPTEALLHYELFLSESPSAPETQVTQVEAQINQLRARVGELQITVLPPDAMGLAVTLDGQAISLNRPAHVAPGHHVIEALAEGYTTVHRELDAVAGQAVVLNLALESNAPAPLPATPTPRVVAPVVAAPAPLPPVTIPRVDSLRRGPAPAVFYAVAGVTGAAAIGWITAGALALSANSDFDATARQVQSGGGDLATLQARGHSEAARANELATWSDVAMTVTLAGAVASTVLLLTTNFHAPVAVGATASSGGAQLSVAGRF